MSSCVANDSQVILDCIRRLFRFLRLSDRAAQTEVKLSGAQLFVLHELGKTPNLSLSELAQRTLTDQSSVSVVVTRLVASGHVSRDRDSRDGRRLVLNLTPAGSEILQRAPLAPQERVIEAMDRLPSADRRKFAQIFERLIDELGESAGVVGMIEFDDRAQAPKKD